jgi:hypothetical protein
VSSSAQNEKKKAGLARSSGETFCKESGFYVIIRVFFALKQVTRISEQYPETVFDHGFV